MHRLAWELVIQVSVSTSPSDSGLSTVKVSLEMLVVSGETLELLVLT